MGEKDEKKSTLGKGIYHLSARPMEIYVDDKDIVYLCDKGIGLEKAIEEGRCWTCDKVLFTRGG